MITSDDICGLHLYKLIAKMMILVINRSLLLYFTCSWGAVSLWLLLFFGFRMNDVVPKKVWSRENADAMTIENMTLLCCAHGHGLHRQQRDQRRLWPR